MGKRGPQPKPSALRALDGGASHRPAPIDEPKPQPIAPPCPAWLLPKAKTLYRELAQKLEPLGLLTEIDGPAFAAYCQEIARYREAQDAIKAAGTTTYTMANGARAPLPEMAIAQRSLELANKLGAQFGLSPTSRVGLGVKTGEKKSKFKAYLEAGKKQQQEN